MRPLVMLFVVGGAVLAGCASPAPAPSRPSAGDPEKLEQARAECQRQSGLQVSTGEINAGGGFSYNPFVSGRAFDECMRARGFSAEAAGDFLSAPDTQPQTGN